MESSLIFRLDGGAVVLFFPGLFPVFLLPSKKIDNPAVLNGGEGFGDLIDALIQIGKGRIGMRDERGIVDEGMQNAIALVDIQRGRVETA